MKRATLALALLALPGCIDGGFRPSAKGTPITISAIADASGDSIRWTVTGAPGALDHMSEQITADHRMLAVFNVYTGALVDSSFTVYASDSIGTGRIVRSSTSHRITVARSLFPDAPPFAFELDLIDGGLLIGQPIKGTVTAAPPGGQADIVDSSLTQQASVRSHPCPRTYSYAMFLTRSTVGSRSRVTNGA